MGIKSRELIKEFFKNGLKPNEKEFEHIIDSSLNLVDDKISINGDFIGIKTSDPKAYLHINRMELDKKGGGTKKTPSFMVGKLKGNYTTISDNQISGEKDGKSNLLSIQPFGGSVRFNANNGLKKQIIFRDSGRIGIGVVNPIAPIHIAIPYIERRAGGGGLLSIQEDSEEEGKGLHAAKDEVRGIGGSSKKTPKGTSGSSKRKKVGVKNDKIEEVSVDSKLEIHGFEDTKVKGGKKEQKKRITIGENLEELSNPQAEVVRSMEDLLGGTRGEPEYEITVEGGGDYYDASGDTFEEDAWVDEEVIEEDEVIEEVVEEDEEIEVVKEDDDPIKLPEERTPIALFLGNASDISLSLSANEISARDNEKGAPLYLNTDGGNIIHFGSIIHSSDKKLKHNIKPLNKGINHLLKLKPVSYKWKAETGNEQDTKYGFIAQDVEKVLNEIVYTQKNNGLKGISSIELIPVLVKAIQQQNNKIESLETRMKKLEKLVLKK